MVTGECLPFMAEFQGNGAALAKLSQHDFTQAVAIGPTPTDKCCRDAKDFTMAVRHISTRMHSHDATHRSTGKPSIDKPIKFGSTC